MTREPRSGRGSLLFAHGLSVEIGIRQHPAHARKRREADGVHGNNSNEHERTTQMNKYDASRVASESVDKTLETGAETVRGLQEGFASTLENVRDVNVKLIEMAQANTDAVFDFARDVAEAKAPSDLAQVWTNHATKQFDMLTKQASNLTTMGQQFASKAETVARRVTKRR